MCGRHLTVQYVIPNKDLTFALLGVTFCIIIRLNLVVIPGNKDLNNLSITLFLCFWL